MIRPPEDTLTLRAGALEAELWPSLGGRIAAFRTRGGPDWLKPIPLDLALPEALRSGGCYPMAPYCGRIEQGRFSFGGRSVDLPPHPISAPHSLHGLAWDSPFTGDRLSDSTAEMTLDHPGGAAWPWAFRLTQLVELSVDALRIGLSLTNTDPETQAVGFGLHPFFPLSPDVRLRFSASEHWRLSRSLVPEALEPISERMDYSLSKPITEGFDDVFADFGGEGRIESPAGRLTVTATPNLPTAVLFSPPGRGFFCFEPISHAPNAHNRPGLPGLARLGPGESVTAAMRIEVET